MAVMAAELALEPAGLIVWSAQALISHNEKTAVVSNLTAERIFMNELRFG
jgi:hypothetical protein